MYRFQYIRFYSAVISWLVARIGHMLRDHAVNPETETIILGTFNPRTPENGADFFYGRRRNHLWRLLPLAFGCPSLKGKSRDEKMSFLREHRVDFIDLVSEVDVDDPANYDDRYIDGRVVKWKDVIGEIGKLPRLGKICLSRKTLGGIPNMKKKIGEVKKYCGERGIIFGLLTSPARIYSAEKQAEWSAFFNGEGEEGRGGEA
jgi:G:T/U-mismatch repair DNA glycosylase